jgi:acetate kinase
MTTNAQTEDGILAINGGSSSLKFALFHVTDKLPRVLTGKFERIGLPDGTLSAQDLATGKKWHTEIPTGSHADCVKPLWQLLSEEARISVRVISHRIVHGGPRLREPQLVSPDVLAELRRIKEFAPLHLPAQIELLEEFARHYPGVPQVACFDTAFHRDMPRVATLLPIPRRYERQGVQRYGFHGLSYSFLMGELKRLAGVEAARGRIILAHLGNGASMAAVRDGRGIDTTMAFTPAAGLVMSSRTGDLDPALPSYFARTEGMTSEQFNDMVNTKSGLLGISESSPDTRDLLAREKEDPRAAEALDAFCYSAKKWIGALSAALGGLDTLVFSAGIGENAAPLRERICDGLGFLGIEIDPSDNDKNAPVISKPGGKVTVRVIRTDEELWLAQAAKEMLATSGAATS